MEQREAKRVIVLIALVVAIGAVSAGMVSLTAADDSVTAFRAKPANGMPLAPDRSAEPVVIAGRAVRALQGAVTSQLFLYAYSAGDWIQIPMQVDEVTPLGAYSAEVGMLDANDEIVFMAKDLGDQAPPGSPITASLPTGPGWYEIAVSDPLSPSQTGWAYLVQSTELTPTYGDLVGFDLGFHRIYTDRYIMGLGVTFPGIDFLMLGGSGVEILDRNKVRVYCQVPFVCPRTEDSLPPVPDGLIKDGPVRVILRDGQMLAYEAMVRWASSYTVPKTFRGDVELSTDFNSVVSGTTYYNAVVTAGLTVDGKPDLVPAEPLSSWWQLSTPNGTVIQVADTAAIGGSKSNYYLDDSTYDASDTGDRVHYGDTGIRISGPTWPVSYTVNIYFPGGTLPSVGSTYEAYSTHPLVAVATVHGQPFIGNRYYLPLVIRHGIR